MTTPEVICLTDMSNDSETHITSPTNALSNATGSNVPRPLGGSELFLRVQGIAEIRKLLFSVFENLVISITKINGQVAFDATTFTRLGTRSIFPTVPT